MPDNARRNLNIANLGQLGRTLTMKLTRRVMMTAAAAVMSMSTAAFADGHQKMDSIHFLIPGGAGGGWD